MWPRSRGHEIERLYDVLLLVCYGYTIPGVPRRRGAMQGIHHLLCRRLRWVGTPDAGARSAT